MVSQTPVQAGRKPSEIKSGDWETLFSGRQHRFRGYKLYDFPRKSWKIERGELKSIPGSPQIDLISLALYDEFELEVTWRVAPGAEGGILYRVMEDEGPTWHSGLEYQLADDTLHPEATKAKRATGALYDVVPPTAAKRVKAIGEYNTTVIRVNRGRVEHWLNGEQILGFELNSPEFRSSVAGSKFRNLPRFGREREGHVTLQHMGDEVAFRMIRVRRLEGGAEVPDLPVARGE